MHHLAALEGDFQAGPSVVRPVVIGLHAPPLPSSSTSFLFTCAGILASLLACSLSCL